MHRSQHFQNLVSIIFVHSATSVPIDCSKNIACSLVGCCLDYANSTLMGISVKNVSPHQHLQSTLARVVTCQRRRISISKTLQEHHWLHMKWRIDYKVDTFDWWTNISEILYHEDFSTSAKILSRRQETRTMFILYENCCAAPAIWNCLHMTLELHHLFLSFEADSKWTISSLPFNILLWFQTFVRSPFLCASDSIWRLLLTSCICTI